MKHSLIRILTIMTLASSISAFAGSNKPADPRKTKSDKANCEATVTPSNSSRADQSDAQSDEDKEKSERKRLIEQQNKQWLHDVQNIVAG